MTRRDTTTVNGTLVTEPPAAGTRHRPHGAGPTGRRPALAVAGVSGGLGASTLAAALALECARRTGASTLVDADLACGGVDVTAGVEHLPGPRWPDLAEAHGEVDGRALAEMLPAFQGCAVLAADGRRDVPSSRSASSWGDLRALVLRGLRQSERTLLVDAPIAALTSLADGGLLCRGDFLVLLGGTDVRRLADLDGVVSKLVDSGWSRSRGIEIGLVTRGRGMPERVLAAIADLTSLPHLGHMTDDVRMARAAERGEWPGSRGRIRRLAVTILDRVDDARHDLARPGRVRPDPGTADCDRAAAVAGHAARAAWPAHQESDGLVAPAPFVPPAA